jgi:hypothetical protein
MQSPKDLMQDIAANHFAQARAAAIIPQSVFILYCSDSTDPTSKSPIGAYIHRSTAEYEMHLMIQGDDYDVASGKTWVNDHTYSIQEVKLSRHKEF